MPKLTASEVVDYTDVHESIVDGLVEEAAKGRQLPSFYNVTVIVTVIVEAEPQPGYGATVYLHDSSELPEGWRAQTGVIHLFDPITQIALVARWGHGFSETREVPRRNFTVIAEMEEEL